jgi:hypothetical protein
VSQPRDDRQDDLFGPSLDKIINLRHPLVRLAAEIDWTFLAGRFSSVCRVGPGQPPLPTRLVAGLLILKHMHNLSDEALRERWVENPYFQYFCGETVFQHEVPFDRSSLTRWRQRLGEEQIAALLQEPLSGAPQRGDRDQRSRTGRGGHHRAGEGRYVFRIQVLCCHLRIPMDQTLAFSIVRQTRSGRPPFPAWSTISASKSVITASIAAIVC